MGFQSRLKVYYIYQANDEEIIRRHAKEGGWAGDICLIEHRRTLLFCLIAKALPCGISEAFRQGEAVAIIYKRILREAQVDDFLQPLVALLKK